MPADLLAGLLGQVGRLQRQVLAPRGLRFSGLSDREVEVLRLVAEGLDTGEIARRAGVQRADDQERAARRHDPAAVAQPGACGRLRRPGGIHLSAGQDPRVGPESWSGPYSGAGDGDRAGLSQDVDSPSFPAFARRVPGCRPIQGAQAHRHVRCRTVRRTQARGHRHLRPRGHPDPRRRRRHDRPGLHERARRQRGPHPGRRRALLLLRAPHPGQHGPPAGGPARRGRRRSSAASGTPVTPPAPRTTCTSRCGRTASGSTRTTSSRRCPTSAAPPERVSSRARPIPSRSTPAGHRR